MNALAQLFQMQSIADQYRMAARDRHLKIPVLQRQQWLSLIVHAVLALKAVLAESQPLLGSLAWSDGYHVWWAKSRLLKRALRLPHVALVQPRLAMPRI